MVGAGPAGRRKCTRQGTPTSYCILQAVPTANNIQDSWGCNLGFSWTQGSWNFLPVDAEVRTLLEARKCNLGQGRRWQNANSFLTGLEIIEEMQSVSRSDDEPEHQRSLRTLLRLELGRSFLLLFFRSKLLQ